MELKELTEAKKNFNRLYRHLDGFLATASFDGDIVAILDINGPDIAKEIPREFVGFHVQVRYYDAEFIQNRLDQTDDGIFVGIPIHAKFFKIDNPIKVDMSAVQSFEIGGDQ